MSDTPRTDAASVKMERLDGDIDEVVSANFARKLERERDEKSDKQGVAMNEPKGCPTPGACSAVVSGPEDYDFVEGYPKQAGGEAGEVVADLREVGNRLNFPRKRLMQEAAVNLAHNILAGERPSQIGVEAMAEAVLEMDAYIKKLENRLVMATDLDL